MEANRREFVAGAAAAGLIGWAPALPAQQVLTPEAFGAKGDGRTNDTAAFAALSAYVNKRGGGTIMFRPVTYIVGAHSPRASVHLGGKKVMGAFPSGDILHFVNCSGPVILRGNGAILRAATGLRFGTFDPVTGQSFEHQMPFTNPEFIASPYVGMIFAERCSGPVDISDFELDGNVGGLRIGGRYGDTGWQIPATGVLLGNNLGGEKLSRIYSHHHALDGVQFYSPPGRLASTVVENVRCEFNGRQGCSLTGGRNYVFENCRFLHTGKAKLQSSPGAGVDIEAGTHPIRNVSFSNCEFSNNTGCGMVADSGDTAGVSFKSCRFIGSSSWSAWPRKPRFQFTGCLFVGALVHPYGDAKSSEATQFIDCDFRDDPALSPTGKIYFGGSVRHPVVNAPAAPNVLFDRCRFRLAHDGGLPFTSKVIYSNCEMSQSYGVRSNPSGTYIGTNRITGNVDISGAAIKGQVILNGRAYR
jgi:hypothetical protein